MARRTAADGTSRTPHASQDLSNPPINSAATAESPKPVIKGRKRSLKEFAEPAGAGSKRDSKRRKQTTTLLVGDGTEVTVTGSNLNVVATEQEVDGVIESKVKARPKRRRAQAAAAPVEQRSVVPPQQEEGGSTRRRRGRQEPLVKQEEEAQAEAVITTPQAQKHKRTARAKVEEQEQVVAGEAEEVKTQDIVEETEEITTAPKRKRKTKAQIKAEASADDEDKDAESRPANDLDGATTSFPVKPKKKRKTAEEKAAEAMPLLPRSTGLKHTIGAHVSASGGVQNAITNAVYIGSNAFALFLKSQRKWENPPLKSEHSESFVSGCKDQGYAAGKVVLPHGSYLVNLAAKEPAKKEQAYTCFLDDLQRCEKLGIKLYNFHPGNTNGHPREEALARVAERLNEAHAATSDVVTLLENMAAGGNTIGGSFSDLAGIIAKVKDKSRVGVCLDTCHAFAAGYDLRSPSAFAETMRAFDEEVGAKYLKAVHLNDSKAPLGSRRDLHFNIGCGYLGLRAFWNVMNDSSGRFWGVPLVLETPVDEEGITEKGKDEKGKVIEDKGVWAGEIKMLEGLVGMDVEGEEFKRMEEELAAKGVKERERLAEQTERKTREARAKAERAGKKGKRGKKVKTENGDEDGGSGLDEAESDEESTG